MARFLDSTSFMRPSCGTRFSEMSSLEITLMREAIFSLNASGRLGNFAQNAIQSVADPVKFFVRLEVDVGATAVDCIHQDFLDVFDDRGVINIDVVCVVRFLLIAAAHFKLGRVHDHIFEAGAGRFDDG